MSEISKNSRAAVLWVHYFDYFTHSIVMLHLSIQKNIRTWWWETENTHFPSISKHPMSLVMPSVLMLRILRHTNAPCALVSQNLSITKMYDYQFGRFTKLISMYFWSFCTVLPCFKILHEFRKHVVYVLYLNKEGN